MFNKKIKFFSLLSIFVITTNLNSYQKLEFTQAQQAYYIDHNKEFLKTIFRDYPKAVFSKYDKFPTTAAALPYLGLLYLFIKNKWYREYESTYSRDKAIFVTVVVLIITAIPTTIFYWLTEYFTNNISQKDKIYKTIKWFLDNYNPDLNANIDLNLKKFVPKDLHKIFDTMHEEYLKHENKYINDNLETFIEQIVNYPTLNSNQINTTINESIEKSQPIELYQSKTMGRFLANSGNISVPINRYNPISVYDPQDLFKIGQDFFGKSLQKGLDDKNYLKKMEGKFDLKNKLTEF
ncbi:hypothetical protein KJ644_01105 [Candidatus Dependentiae bacterium]|nr:hypothetical protein [Candidatus Dependentiae bacterium]MBU4387048.1 hypothetical protein [Candidatus Dependentiae bacterium]MCG2756684.1 hypothetical protein [Candidatus Dependentiae bacterium]